MHRLRQLLFNSCRSTSSVILPPPSSSNSIHFSPDRVTKQHKCRTKIDSHFNPNYAEFSDEDDTTPLGASARSKELARRAVEESTAVVKKSEDPRRDFRRSMVEMVVEKEMYDAVELEELLRCFLSLNSTQHHAAIVAAFADVWEALFHNSVC